VTPAELVAKWEHRRATYLPDSSVKADTVFTEIISDLQMLDGVDATLYVDTDRAAAQLALSPKTVANYCKAGRFPGARKTGDRGGKWTIPAKALADFHS